MMEDIGSTLKGIYRDRLENTEGHVIYDSGWKSNAIVNNCRILLAGFMKNESPLPFVGIDHLSVGKGEDDWDQQGAPAPDPNTTTALVTPYPESVPELKRDYLDENDQPVAGPTSRLQITATLPPGFPAPLAGLNTYPLREFGLFGRFGDQDYMINCVRHTVIHKDKDVTLQRMIRLYF